MASEASNPSRWRAADYSLLAACFIPAAVLTWGIHESAHWLMGELLGYDMWITFNQVGLVSGSYASRADQLLVAMAGPLVTWVQAVVAYLLIRRSRRLWAYAFLFLTLWSRGLAMIISFISQPNDEARASLLLGWPMGLLPSLSVLFVLVFTMLGSRALRAGWKGNAVAYAAASIVTTIIVFADQALFGG